MTLQKLSVAYINTQKMIEELYKQDINLSPYSKEFIALVHKTLYSSEGIHKLLEIEGVNKDSSIIHMIPGEFRDQDVEIGKHLAPTSSNLKSLLEQYEYLYKIPVGRADSSSLIHAISSHHRLLWLHPFLDGNGRVSRLVLDGLFYQMGLKGYGLWNMSRGLARNTFDYKDHLCFADMKMQGSMDGRGPLSNKQLEQFVLYMLNIAIDQIDYMGEHLKLNKLSTRIKGYVEFSQKGMLSIKPLPDAMVKLMNYLLLHGEVERGKVPSIVGMAERTARLMLSNLIKRGYFESTTPKSPIRIKFNATFASYLFPDLIDK
jgi:Fic family protein